MDAFAADPAAVAQVSGPPGLHIEVVGAANARDAIPVRCALDAPSGSVWSEQFVAQLAASPHATVLVATLGHEPVGVAWMYTSHRTAWLRGAAVVPAARGQGVHGALISERARLAAEAGCNLVGSWAALGSASARNLAEVGFERIGTREHHIYAPANVAAPA
jgi:GNAT superfamily N-acetyltransferase